MLRGYFRFNNKSCFFPGYTELLTQKNWHNWSVLMEDVCINNKLLSKEALLVMLFHYFCATVITVWVCQAGNWKCRALGSQRKCWHRSKGMIPILLPKLQDEMQAFLNLAFNLLTAMHTLLNRQAREVDESSPRGD